MALPNSFDRFQKLNPIEKEEHTTSNIEQNINNFVQASSRPSTGCAQPVTLSRLTSTTWSF
eukprot:8861521-Prorocentrum_lima.AAC.1